MSVTIDTNVLVYASNEHDPSHAEAYALLRRLAEGPGIVYVFWPVLMGYLRIVTHPGILETPLAPSIAMSNVGQLVSRPHVRTMGEPDDFWTTFSAVAGPRARGNEVPDAHIVALMRLAGVPTIYSRDRGLRRYDGITVLDLAA